VAESVTTCYFTSKQRPFIAIRDAILTCAQKLTSQLNLPCTLVGLLQQISALNYVNISTSDDVRVATKICKVSVIVNWNDNSDCVVFALVDLGFLEGVTLRGSGLTGEWNLSVCELGRGHIARIIITWNRLPRQGGDYSHPSHPLDPPLLCIDKGNCPVAGSLRTSWNLSMALLQYQGSCCNIYLTFPNTDDKNIVRTYDCRTARQNDCTYGSPLKHTNIKITTTQAGNSAQET